MVRHDEDGDRDAATRSQHCATAAAGVLDPRLKPRPARKAQSCVGRTRFWRTGIQGKEESQAFSCIDFSNAAPRDTGEESIPGLVPRSVVLFAFPVLDA